MSTKTLFDKLQDQTAVLAAINNAIHADCLRHAQHGQSIVGWRDGHLVRVGPADVLVQAIAHKKPPGETQR